MGLQAAQTHQANRLVQKLESRQEVQIPPLEVQPVQVLLAIAQEAKTLQLRLALKTAAPLRRQAVVLQPALEALNRPLLAPMVRRRAALLVRLLPLRMERRQPQTLQMQETRRQVQIMSPLQTQPMPATQAHNQRVRQMEQVQQMEQEQQMEQVQQMEKVQQMEQVQNFMQFYIG